MKMENMWNIPPSNETEITPPSKIVEIQCGHLREKTAGAIIAKIAIYDGPIFSYKTLGIMDSITSPQGMLVRGRHVDIQEDLGEIGENYFTYELFITSIHTPNYKYRVMFLGHGIGFYPLDIVVDEEIAKELGEEIQTLVCDDESIFVETLSKILGSTKVKQVINALMVIASE